MNRIKPIYDLTLKMKETLDQEFTANERDVIIEKVEFLLQKREELMAGLSKPYTNEETALGKELVKLNEEAHARMNQLFLTLKQEMKQVNKQKHSNKNYVNPYRNVAVMDGMYMDKKK